MSKKKDKLTEAYGDRVNFEQFLPYLFNRVTNKTNITMGDFITQLNFTVPQWRVIAVLNAFGELSVGELADQAVVRQSTLSRVVDQLEKQGLVRRKTFAKNKRVVHVNLTEKGGDMFEKMYPSALAIHFLMTSALTKNELKSLYSILDKLIERMQ